MREIRGKTAGLLAALLFIPIAAQIQSCGGGGGNGGGGGEQPGQVPPAANFSGKFQGTEQGTQGNVPINSILTLTLTQTGNQISGNYTSSDGGIGSVTGTAAGNGVSFTGKDSITGCAFSGTGTLNGNELTGKATAPQSGNCSSLDESFDLFKQPQPSPTPTVTVTTTPSCNVGTETCSGTEREILARSQDFKPQASGFCTTDEDCDSSEGTINLPSGDSCFGGCRVGTSAQVQEWKDFVDSDSFLQQLCEDRFCLDCPAPSVDCLSSRCQNHVCVAVAR